MILTALASAFVAARGGWGRVRVGFETRDFSHGLVFGLSNFLSIDKVRGQEGTAVGRIHTNMFDI